MKGDKIHTMQLELSRFGFLVFPYVFCTTLAALIIWGEDLQKLFPKFIIYVVIAAIVQTATYQIHIEAIRFILEVIAGVIIAKIVFCQSYKWTFKIYASSYFIGIISVIIEIGLSVLLLDIPVAQLEINSQAWLKIVLPINLMVVILAYLIHKAWIPGINFFYDLKEKTSEMPTIITALFIQTILFIALISQIPSNYVNSEAAWMFISLAILFGLSIYILLKYMQINKIEVITTQDAVSENIMEMINTVRAQRHDFLNHLQVIDGLNRQKNNAVLDQYLSSLVKGVSNHNEMLKIDNPIIAALVNAKIAQANGRGINLQAHIESNLVNFSVVAVDLARILGNLIDNALDAAEETGENWIKLEISEKGPLVAFSITNPFIGDPKNLEQAFTAGVTSKPKHDGLGLYIAQKLSHKLHGNLKLSFEKNNDLTFSLTIPQIYT